MASGREDLEADLNIDEVAAVSIISDRTSSSPKHRADLEIEEELLQGAKRRIEDLSKGGVAQERGDIKEPLRHYLPDLLNMEEYEDWAREASHTLTHGYTRRQKREVVGEKIDVADILKDVSTLDGRMKKCRHLLFLGATGMGKTTLMIRIADYGRQGKYEWLKGKLIVTPDLRTFSAEEKILPSNALLGSMFWDWSSKRMEQRYQWIVDNSEKVVFLLDSLDTLWFDLQNERPRMTYNEAATTDVILHNLLAGDLFQKSIIISSSREYKVRNMHPSVRPDRCVELDGLPEKSVRDLINGFLGEDKGEEVKTHIDNECPDVWPLLSIPIFTVLSLIGFVRDGFKPKTMSGILVKYFVSLIHSSHARVKYILPVLNKLMSLSFDGIREGRVLFTPSDIKRLDLTVLQVTDLGILIPQSHGPYLVSKLFQNDRFFLYFNHKSEQECLAALFVLSTNLHEFTVFIERHFEQQNFAVVRRLICGILLNDEVFQAAGQLTKVSDATEKRNILLQTLANAIKSGKLRNQNLLDLFIELNESKGGVTELIRSSVKEIGFAGISLSRSDVYAVASVMKHCQYLRLVRLIQCNLNGEKMEILTRTVMRSTLKIGEIRINGNDVGEKGMFQLAKVAKHCETKTIWAWECGLERKRLEAFLDGANGLEITAFSASYNENIGLEGMFNLGRIVESTKLVQIGVRQCKLSCDHLKRFEDGAGNAKFRKFLIGNNSQLSPEGLRILGRLVKNRNVKDLDASWCNFGPAHIKRFVEGLGDAKVDIVNLEDKWSEPLYTCALLDLAHHVDQELDLRGWKINKFEKQELQRCLNRTRSPTFEIVLDGSDNEMRLKASQASLSPEFDANQTLDDLAKKLSENLTRSISTAKVIGNKDGRVDLQGCMVEFLQNAFDEDTVIALTVRSADHDIPEGLEPISPTLNCRTSKVKFRGLATVKLTTYCKVENVDDNVVICKKKSKGQWENIDAEMVPQGDFITFQVDHFCKFRLFRKIFKKKSKSMKILLKNFLFFNDEKSAIFGLTCLRDATVEDECIRLLRNDCYRPAMPIPDNIQLREDERMSYSLECRHPRGSELDPNEQVSYTGATFTHSSNETQIFSLSPTPENGIVRIQYTLNRQDEDRKVSVLPLQWNSEQQVIHRRTSTTPLQSTPESQATQGGSVDVTAFVPNVHVRGSTDEMYNSHVVERDNTVYYINPHLQKGKVLIINNDFQGNRLGSDVDVKNMRELWMALGFEVIPKMNLTAQQMLDSCHQFAADIGEVSAVVVIIMTHGGKTQDGKEFFEGEDNRPLTVEAVLKVFNHDEYPHLLGIPKFFIFQACRGEAQELHMEDVDARGTKDSTPNRADVLIAYPTQSGYQATRHREEGSWLMNAITRVFMEHAFDTHVLDMLTMVNDKVASRVSAEHWIQISNQESYFRKKLYLFPGFPKQE